ncbi:nicotinate-nucleotide adenylyltransferase [Lysobacter soli]|uniref:nicotinate-nucleotide adenylyltransferase n=1 Tax=Lysobacter soli TaxID=453783 RepID=UPI002410B112|nr:nicotinate-nucleotide adenylyltransferase [Lysobacter soli]MDG2516495.1 nicotinate-nucleotide adenylyltransferase [Lysobacter soli]
MSLRVYYGGTFDPVHAGHLSVACEVRDALGAQVFLVPAADPPHKDATHADAEARARMLDLAIAGEPGLKVDRRELHRDGPSYTVDTLRGLRAELGPEMPLVWMIGGDSLLQLNTWHRWRELFDLAHVLVVARPGSHLEPVAVAAAAAEIEAEIAPRRRPAESLNGAPAGGLAVFPLHRERPESSTELRRRMAAGEPWEAGVPPAVAEYIRRHGLYGVRGVTPASL